MPLSEELSTLPSLLLAPIFLALLVLGTGRSLSIVSTVDMILLDVVTVLYNFVRLRANLSDRAN